VLAPIAAVAVVVAVIVLLLVINRHSSHGTSPAALPTPSFTATVLQPSKSFTPTPTPTPTPSRSKDSHEPKPAVATAMAPVQVLNNSRRTGLAHEVAAQVQGRGWSITAVGNLRGLVAETTVYFAPGDSAAAAHLAREFSSIRRVEPNTSGGIHATGLTLVLTADWAG
jgi:LytR cell envelope-related transcriptional attenuator